MMLGNLVELPCGTAYFGMVIDPQSTAGCESEWKRK